MKKYYIFRIEKDGKPKLKQTIHAHTIDSAWNGNKCWYIEGLFLVSSTDGTEAKTFALHRDDPPAATPETDETPANMFVCERCLMAIESREGRQITRAVYLDADDPRPCDWCEETFDDVLYEIL